MASARQPRLEKQFKAQSTESSEGTLFNWSCLLSPKNWIGCLTVREVQYSRMILKYILSLNFFPRALFEFRLTIEVREHIKDSFYSFYHWH